MIRYLLTVFAILYLAPFSHSQQLGDIDDYIQRGMQEWDIPGMSVSVVHNSDVLVAKGYGIKKLGETDPVDEHTLFGIASTTKAFTALSILMLQEEGHLNLDDPIVKYLPEFKLYDPYVTQNITIRDALTHRSGLGRMTGNRIQYMPNRTQQELMYRMRYMEPEQPFRQQYVYSNMMYMVAGEIIRSITGMAWYEFVNERIFEPLGMENTNTSITQISDTDNTAWPHQEFDGEVKPIPRRNFDNVGASASINSSAYDMAIWMRMHLGTPGEFEGTEIIPVNAIRDMYRPITTTPSNNREAAISSYALGWTVSSYEGRTVYRHGGATDGMNTNLIIIPEENMGVFITTNTFNTFMSVLGNEILDRLLGVEPRDWFASSLNNYRASYQRIQNIRDEIHAERKDGTSPSHQLSSFEGSYYDYLYDTVEVKMGENGLELHFWDDETQIADLEHWHHDTFRAHWRNPAQREKFVYFTMGLDGNPEELRVQFTLRPMLLQVGIYPTNYYRWVHFKRQ